MKILVLGGTGAMGKPLVRILAEKKNQVYVTTRSIIKDSDGVKYIQGDAHDDVFLNRLLKEKFDVIVDFMVYDTPSFYNCIEKLLGSTNQYLFFSSCRVYADSRTPLKEDSPRLIDTIKDKNYINTDEYALAKAKEENILFNSKYNNWTIIRPYITYNDYRLQLGTLEKELWLMRALNNYTIVFPEDILEKYTTLTYGDDVSEMICRLIGNENAIGKVFHITTSQCVKWFDILNKYISVIERETGLCPKVKTVKSSESFQKFLNPWQIKYDRLYDRKFDNSLIIGTCGHYEFKDVFEGLDDCLTTFIRNSKWISGYFNPRFEAYCDRLSKESQNVMKIPGKKNKLKYIKWRFFSDPS